MTLPQLECRAWDAKIEDLPVLAFGLFQNSELPDFLRDDHPNLFSQLSLAVDQKSFTGKLNQILTLYAPDDKAAPVFVVVGLGKKAEYNSDRLRQAAASVAKSFISLNVERAAVEFFGESQLQAEDVQALAEGLIMGSYRFLDYKSEDDENPVVELKNVSVLSDKATSDALGYGEHVAAGVCLARDLGQHPSNIATPTYLAETAERIGDSPNVHVQVFEREEFTEMGFGGLAGVAQGTDVPPKFILMEYKGGGPKTLGLVGKGLTFDSGGISIKPAAGMDEMKYDMLGGAAVLGIMESVARVQPKINIIAAVPATENMSGGKAYKPGDILTAYNGKTIEILNTDAEGRLILADALAYVTENYELDGLMDYATLTGAVIVALGHRYSGIMTNDEAFLSEVRSAAEDSQDRVWQLPLDDEYAEDIKSKIADVKNTGAARQAGTIAAGQFLREFVKEGTPWCHVDIAGSGWLKKGRPYNPDGATGAGVRMTLELIKSWSA